MLDTSTNPAMRVKNTFLEFVPSEPPPDLRRYSTTPAGETADTLEARLAKQEEHLAQQSRQLAQQQQQLQQQQQEIARQRQELAGKPPDGAWQEPARVPDFGVCSIDANTSAERSGLEQQCRTVPPHAPPAKLVLRHLQTGDSLCADDLENDTFHSPREATVPSPVGDSVGGHHGPWRSHSGDRFHSPREALAQQQFVAGEPALVVKNTFIDLHYPEAPDALNRSATHPVTSQDTSQEDKPLPELPKLPLETFVTDDRFEDPIDEPAPPIDFLGPACNMGVFQHGYGMPQAGLGVPSCTLPAGPPTAPPSGPPNAPPAVPSTAPPPGPPSQWPPPPPEAPPVVEVPGDADLPAVPDGDATFKSICQPNKVTCTECASTGWSRVQWAVDARKIEGKDKHAVSPPFMLDLPKHGPAVFRIQLYPRPTNQGRGGEGFKKAKGRGRIELKCESVLSQDVDEVTFCIGIGIGSKQQTTRGPVSVNFLEHTCGGLPKAEEEWEFASAIDDSRTFLVFVELSPPVQASIIGPEETSQAGSS